MKNNSAAYFLFLGTFIMLLTMIYHPARGGFETLANNPQQAIISHALAILSVPFLWLGLKKFNLQFENQRILTDAALAIMAIGLLAALLAATLNGLAQPLFAMRYRDASPETIEAIRPIFDYNTALNHAFDYILVGSIFLSVLLWSLAIILSNTLPRWIGFVGLALGAAGASAILSGFNFLHLHGFRIFIFGWMFWIITIAVAMLVKRSL